MQTSLFPREPVDTYSLAVCLPDGAESIVRTYKDILGRNQWFPSKNSAGHITINNFSCTAEEYLNLEHSFAEFCNGQKSFEIHVSGTGIFTNGTFYLDFDERTKLLLSNLMKSANALLPNSKNTYKSHNPHLTIGRGLTQDQLQIAEEKIRSVNFIFECRYLCLRKLNLLKGQYNIQRFLPFG